MRLYQFPFSHFCEKARWALDLCAINYQVTDLLPGFHRLKLLTKGVKGSVPVLETPTTLIDGSTEIVKFALKSSRKPIGLVEATGAKATEWHQRLNQDGGASLQTLVYGLLLSDREKLIQLWSQNELTQTAYRIGFGPIESSLREMYHINPQGTAQAHERLSGLLRDLDKLYQEKEFLLTDTFSCVDLSMAALLSPLAEVKEHSFYPRFVKLGIDTVFHSLIEKYSSYRTCNKVAEFYQKYRN